MGENHIGQRTECAHEPFPSSGFRKPKLSLEVEEKDAGHNVFMEIRLLRSTLCDTVLDVATYVSPGARKGAPALAEGLELGPSATEVCTPDTRVPGMPRVSGRVPAGFRQGSAGETEPGCTCVRRATEIYPYVGV